VSVGNKPVGLVEKQRAQRHAEERRHGVAAGVLLDTGDDEAREGRGEHHARCKAQRGVERPLGGVPPHEYQRRTEEVHPGDDEPAEQS
jgi:hypothetical protein